MSPLNSTELIFLIYIRIVWKAVFTILGQNQLFTS